MQVRLPISFTTLETRAEMPNAQTRKGGMNVCGTTTSHEIFQQNSKHTCEFNTNEGWEREEKKSKSSRANSHLILMRKSSFVIERKGLTPAGVNWSNKHHRREGRWSRWETTQEDIWTACMSVYRERKDVCNQINRLFYSLLASIII